MAHPDMIYEPIISTHDATLPRYKDALASTDDQVRAFAFHPQFTPTFVYKRQKPNSHPAAKQF